MKARELIIPLVLGVAVFGGVLAYSYHRNGGGARRPSAPVPADDAQSAAPAASTQEKESGDYAPIWETFASPAKPQARPAPKKAEVKFQLKGVLLQKGQRLAVIEDSTGRQRLVPEGGTIEGAKVTSISANEITIEIGGERIALPLKGKPGAAPRR